MKNSDRKLIHSAYDALYVLNNIRMTAYRDRLYNLCVQEEREHRDGRTGFNASVPDCARMFVVYWIAGYLTRRDHIPTIRQTLILKQSCILAAALVQTYRKEIRAALKGFDLKQLSSFDYCEVIK